MSELIHFFCNLVNPINQVSDMSALAALKGYRTQFLYSLYYILSNQEKPYNYRLEGEEDLDVLDEGGHILYAIQVKNLGKTLTLSDLITHRKTSFLKRFIDIYPTSIPVLTSFGTVSTGLRAWKENPHYKDKKELEQFQKVGITEKQIAFIKESLQIIEVDEEIITAEILRMLKVDQSIDPVPTAENLLYFIQYTAEKQQLITSKDLLDAVIRMGIYLSERIAFTNQYGIYISPLIKTELSELEIEKLKEEFYYGISARYVHIHAGLDVERDSFLKAMDEGLSKYNVLVISGASGQGKSTLAYRYAFNKASGSLVYEVNLQGEPAKVNEAVLAISALTKGLRVPVYFILHVAPNTISWLKIAREFANHSYLRLLVTIRKEDLFLAKTHELNFLYTEIELELAKEEAEVIFQRLEDKHLIHTHNDFKDAWVACRSGVPLMEFIHAITQGSSLKEKLYAQVAQLKIENAENPIGQIELLRTLCLADAYGARIDVTLIRDIPNIKLFIDKFEKEYLLKHSSDRRYLSGLHPIRSMLLVEILFDEFVVCKKDYVISCLKIIEQEDAYFFLLNALYQRIISAEELIVDFKSSERNNWVIYGAATKSLLWVGIRDYIDENISLISEVQAKFGDAWSIVIDLYHGTKIDIEGILSMMTGNNPQLLNFVRDSQRKLSPKSEVYVPIIELFNQIPLPQVPISTSEWLNFAETLFWLGETDNNGAKLSVPVKENFKTAFESLDVQSLAMLMLGMYVYSEEYNQIRLDLAPIFNEKLRNKFQIPFLEFTDEIKFDFLIDITKEDQHIGWHEKTIRIIDLLRSAYPEKTMISSQGHGHRFNTIPLFHDETVKSISAEHLPLENWVNVNANTISLIDYPGRPDDWSEFHQRLRDWETQIKGVLSSFCKSFHEFRKVNKFEALVAVADQASYKSLNRLIAPKNTVDPLGISTKTKVEIVNPKKKDEKDEKEIYFANKYDGFIKSYNDYKSALETFIQQSGQACYEGAKQSVDGDHIDEHNLHLTFVNLYRAAEKRVKFQSQRDKLFRKFSGSNTEIGDRELFETATTWKSFWTAIQAGDPKRIQLTENITSLKSDFLIKLGKAIKKANGSSNLKIIFRMDEAIGFLPLFTVKVSDPLYSIIAVRECYNLFAECVIGTEFQSLKYMMLQRYFPKIYIINEIGGHLFDFKWYTFTLHVLLDTTFEKLTSYHFNPEEIDPQLAANLKLTRWLTIRSGTGTIQKLANDFEKLKLYIGHLADLDFFNENERIDEIGNAMITKHVETVGILTVDIWNDLLEGLTDLAEEFPKDEDKVISDEEQEYWTILLELMNSVVPKEAELDNAFLDLATLADWSKRFTALNDKWGLFILLLQKKVMVGFGDDLEVPISK